MIRIAEQNLNAQFAERLLRQTLHRAGRAHRHERRRVDDAVRRRETPQARAGRIGFQNLEVKFHPCEFSRTMRHCRVAVAGDLVAQASAELAVLAFERNAERHDRLKCAMSYWTAATGNRGDQRLRVGMRGRGEDLRGGACFDDAAALHDGDARGELRDHGQAVRNQQVGEREIALQILQQLQNLRADGNIERGNRLVGHHQARAQHQGARDADALPLAAGKFVRVARERVFAQADGAQDFDDALRGARRGRGRGS